MSKTAEACQVSKTAEACQMLEAAEASDACQMSKTAKASEKSGVYQTARPLTVVLLYGGISNERPVSFRSAEGIQAGLEIAGHKVIKIDTGKPRFIEELLKCGADVAFIALHGKGGEDGAIQGLLELAGIPYTGSGVLASALGMDKMRSKLLFEAAGLMTPAATALTISDLQFFADVDEGQNNDQSNTQKRLNPTTALSAKNFSKEFLDMLIEKIGLPCVVKPSKEGSSFGVSIVRSCEQLCQALIKGFALSAELLIERYITGTEVTVPVVGNNNPETLPVIEIIPVNEFYDYESKYSQGGSAHIIPARLDPEQLNACEDAACIAHEIIGCRGLSRVDMIVDADGIPWIIEINTIPGLTPTSLVPDAARVANISMAELCDRLLMWAFEDKPLGFFAKESFD